MKDFPIEVSLGREMPDYSEAAPASPKKSGKKRMVFPTLYIDEVEGMPALPKEGAALVYFRRKRMSVEENCDGKETAGVTLEIRKLCLAEDADEDVGEEMGRAMAKFAKGAGVETGHAEPDGDESDEDED